MEDEKQGSTARRRLRQCKATLVAVKLAWEIGAGTEAAIRQADKEHHFAECELARLSNRVSEETR